jgi:hypothetical protein
MRIEPEIGSVNVVLIGAFNPAIFHPSWFGANGLLSSEEVDGAEVEIVHRELAKFRVGDWLDLQVDRERFVAQTNESPFVRLLDLVVNTFRGCLHHTPLRLMGINRQVHFRVGDPAVCDRIGKILAPQGAWGEWGACLAGKSLETRGGLRSLTMQQQGLEDRDKGYILAKVEPSSRILGGVGIFMEINDHYELVDPSAAAGAQQMMDLLAARFEESIGRSEWIIDQIMALKDRI